MPRLLSVSVGLPRDVTWNGKTVRTAIWKSPVERNTPVVSTTCAGPYTPNERLLFVVRRCI
jgi:hypothetical protein